jgi:hypothetical protein
VNRAKQGIGCLAGTLAFDLVGIPVCIVMRDQYLASQIATADAEAMLNTLIMGQNVLTGCVWALIASILIKLCVVPSLWKRSKELEAAPPPPPADWKAHRARTDSSN